MLDEQQEICLHLPTPAHTKMQEQTHPEKCIASAVENEGESERNLPDAGRKSRWLALVACIITVRSIFHFIAFL